MADTKILTITPDPIQWGNYVTVTYSVNPIGTPVDWHAANGFGQSNIIASGTADSGTFGFSGKCFGRGGNYIEVTVGNTSQIVSTNCPD
jgi:hypothetical protein